MSKTNEGFEIVASDMIVKVSHEDVANIADISELMIGFAPYFGMKGHVQLTLQLVDLQKRFPGAIRGMWYAMHRLDEEEFRMMVNHDINYMLTRCFQPRCKSWIPDEHSRFCVGMQVKYTNSGKSEYGFITGVDEKQKVCWVRYWWDRTATTLRTTSCSEMTNMEDLKPLMVTDQNFIDELLHQFKQEQEEV
jgi:hypothetical protein